MAAGRPPKEKHFKTFASVMKDRAIELIPTFLCIYILLDGNFW
jgi:hypothetical protein